MDSGAIETDQQSATAVTTGTVVKERGKSERQFRLFKIIYTAYFGGLQFEHAFDIF